MSDIIKKNEEVSVPKDKWIKCNGCGEIHYLEELSKNTMICPDCNFHIRINWEKRVEISVDKDSFVEFDSELKESDPILFPGYLHKKNKITAKINLNEAVVTGKATIYDIPTVIAIMDSNFMMGSMGSIVGEKITRAFEYATEHKLPIIVFTASGGARMQEGIFSLMQMVKVSAAVNKHSQEGLLYVTVLTDPTSGGVTASFAMQGDIILSEPQALICFAGPRVIKQTIGQDLPNGFQKAEFLLAHGFIDKIVSRKELKSKLHQILQIHS